MPRPTSQPGNRPLHPWEAAGLVELGHVLRKARWQLGLTQRELGQRCGLDQSTISRLENGRLRFLALVRLGSLVYALNGHLDLRELR